MPDTSVYNNIGHNSLWQDSILKLVTKAQDGQEQAATELYNLFFDKIFRFIYYRVGHKETGEDLTEEVFTKAFTSLANLKEPNAFEGWLYQIARNKVIDYYRSKKIVIALDEIENTLEYETNIIDTVNLEFQQKLIVKVLKQLPSDQQKVIKLKFFEDLTNAEIAQLLEKPEGAVRVIQHRAINKLKNLLAAVTDDEKNID